MLEELRYFDGLAQKPKLQANILLNACSMMAFQNRCFTKNIYFTFRYLWKVLTKTRISGSFLLAIWLQVEQLELPVYQSYILWISPEPVLEPMLVKVLVNASSKVSSIALQNLTKPTE
jgi:hypothetical protein